MTYSQGFVVGFLIFSVLKIITERWSPCSCKNLFGSLIWGLLGVILVWIWNLSS